MAIHFESAANGAQQANTAAREGMDMMTQTVDGMGRIRNAVEIASNRITELGTQSAEVGRIVGLIDDIAAQTNLLSLNAAIEAARAGEQGKGFAVVADEVKRLADRVAVATREVTDLIGNIRTGVNESIMATEEGTKEVGEGVRLAEEAGKALSNIQSSVQAVASKIEEISETAGLVSVSSSEMVKTIEGVSQVAEQTSVTAQQMATNSSEVTDAIDGIAAITQQNSVAIQQVAASTEQMSSEVQQVINWSGALAQMADQLQRAVSKLSLGADQSGTAPEAAD